MNLSFGDIVLINFDPSTGREFKKIRPAIFLQDPQVSKYSPYLTVMPISTKIQNFGPQDVFIPKDHKNKLVSDSVIRVHQISSFDRRRFIKIIGNANSPVIRKVRGYLRKHFGM